MFAQQVAQFAVIALLAVCIGAVLAIEVGLLWSSRRLRAKQNAPAWQKEEFLLPETAAEIRRLMEEAAAAAQFACPGGTQPP